MRFCIICSILQTAKGEIVIVRNDTHDERITDLFFALRGGGGGTYAIVYNTTFKIHNQTELSPTNQFTLFQAIYSFRDLQTQEITSVSTLNGVWNFVTQQMNDGRWSGYIRLVSASTSFPINNIQLIWLYDRKSKIL